jgi:hypothetical protein
VLRDRHKGCHVDPEASYVDRRPGYSQCLDILSLHGQAAAPACLAARRAARGPAHQLLHGHGQRVQEGAEVGPLHARAVHRQAQDQRALGRGGLQLRAAGGREPGRGAGCSITAGEGEGEGARWQSTAGEARMPHPLPTKGGITREKPAKEQQGATGPRGLGCLTHLLVTTVPLRPGKTARSTSDTREPLARLSVW